MYHTHLIGVYRSDGRFPFLIIMFPMKHSNQFVLYARKSN